MTLAIVMCVRKSPINYGKKVEKMKRRRECETDYYRDPVYESDHRIVRMGRE